MTDRCCSVVDSIECAAPPGYGAPASVLTTCFSCGNDVCRSCSSVLIYLGRRSRVCINCQDMRGIISRVGRAAKETSS